MPLMVTRLRKSKAWVKAKRNPALGFYMINLWASSWHEVPAGSLEDDDDVLADAAMCDPAKWAKVKADVLRGWVKCSDGRLYHPVVCERVMEAWKAKTERAEKNAHEAERKRLEREERSEHFATLKAAGIHRPWTTGLTELRELVRNLSAGQVKPDLDPSRLREGQGDGEGQGEGQGDLNGGGAKPAAPAATPAADAAATRGKRLPEGWVLPNSWGRWALDEFKTWTPDAVRNEAAKFRDHWVGKSGKDATKLDWEATWRNWCRSARNPTPLKATTAADAHQASLDKVARMQAAMGIELPPATTDTPLLPEDQP